MDDLTVEPSVYKGSKVYNLVISNGYCFVGADYGIWQIDNEVEYSQFYDYPFIGSVQDMYIQGEILVVGSENSLNKYLWNKNL